MPYTKGAKKAMRAIKARYGKNWAHVFYGRASRFGKGRTPHARADSIYTKGHHRVRNAKRRKKR